jgi:hypothetical protein
MTFIPMSRVETGSQCDKGFSREHKIPHERLMDHFSSWAENQFGKQITFTSIVSYIKCNEDESRVKEPTTDIEDDVEDAPNSSRKPHRVTKGGKKHLWQLDEDENGRAILPQFDGNPSRQNLMDVIRSLVTHTYREHFNSFHQTHLLIMTTGKYTNNARASVPWAFMTKDKVSWMNGWPADIPVQDPSKIQVATATRLYYHWLQSKRQNITILEFTKALAKDKRSKRGEKKRKYGSYVDVTSDQDSSDEELAQSSKARKGRGRVEGKGKGKVKGKAKAANTEDNDDSDMDTSDSWKSGETEDSSVEDGSSNRKHKGGDVLGSDTRYEFTTLADKRNPLNFDSSQI